MGTKELLALDGALEDAGRPVDDRAALLDGAWKLLPDVARENPEAAAHYRAEIRALVGLAGPSQALLAAWKDRIGPAAKREKRRRGERT